MAETPEGKPWDNADEKPAGKWRERKGRRAKSPREDAENGQAGKGKFARNPKRGKNARGRGGYASGRKGDFAGERGTRTRREGADRQGSEREKRDYEPQRRGRYGRARYTGDKRGQGTSVKTRRLEVPAAITSQMLDREVWRRLSPLPAETAENVARHLVMAGELVDDDPALAYEHAKAALKMAWRIDVVREAVALTAYACGKYAEALREVRTVRRMSGLEVLKSVEADAQRGLGRPEKALEVIAAANVEELERAERLELAIVESAARADMGEHETGLAVIEAALRSVDPKTEAFEYGRLLSVKADRLRELGHALEAEQVEALIPREVEDIPVLDIEAAQEAEERANPTFMQGTNVALAAAFPLILTDLDGVTWNGEAEIPGAAPGIAAARENGSKVMFLTNNAARPPRDVVSKLNGVGIAAVDAEVVTSAQDGAATLARVLKPGDKVLCIGGEGVPTAVREAGLEVVESADDEPVAVLQGLGFDIGWAQLSEACYAIAAGARWVATNLDPALPTERGRSIGNGSFVEAVRNATKATPIVCGKPEASIYDLAVDRASKYLAGIDAIAAEVSANETAAQEARAQAAKHLVKDDPDTPEMTPEQAAEAQAAEERKDREKAAERARKVYKRHALVIDDQLSTGILGANEAGIASCVVMTGLTQPRDLVLAPQRQRPNFVVLDLSDLGRVYPRPELRQRGWWYTENTRARVSGRHLEVRGLGVLDTDGTEVSLAEFRAILAAAWYAREQGVRVQCPEFTVVREVTRTYEDEDLDDELNNEADAAALPDNDTEGQDS